MKKKLDYFKEIIEKNNFKFTKQKELVLTTLLKSQTHLNADEISMKLKHHKIGIATIYRGLNQFTDLGIIKELNINGTSYYEMKMFGQKPLHIHFKCDNCGEITDIDNQDLSIGYIELNQRIEDDMGLEILDTDLLLKGICAKCKTKTT